MKGCPHKNAVKQTTDELEQELKEQISSNNNDNNKSSNKHELPCYYHSYLNLDKILNANDPRSGFYEDEPVHDEHLFITIHQSYELWFKQILYELRSCIKKLNAHYVQNRQLLTINSRFQRINTIMKILVEQFSVLDTMTPMDFLDFRKYLYPASGFQSLQFRILENVLGLNCKQRMRYNKQDYKNVLNKHHQKIIKKIEDDDKNTLFYAIERWLERYPYMSTQNWSFWAEYKKSVNNYLDDEKQACNDKDFANKQYISNQETFECIFNVKKFNQLRDEGKIRISHKALQNALMILLYRDEPLLQMPYQLIQNVMNLDNLLTNWRNAHSLMVHRQLGSKMGTGGSSGFHYLRTAAIHHKVFIDFFNLSTYMIPKRYVPLLPQSLKFLMTFPTTNKSTIINDIKPNNNKQFITKDIPKFASIDRALSASPVIFKKSIPVSLNNNCINSNNSAKNVKVITNKDFFMKKLGIPGNNQDDSDFSADMDSTDNSDYNRDITDIN
mmetsp:Transcript_102011/g.124815  ORF Transcript_102011/g.124815 Transcript_102011/m.124815 type:complete len:499 (+) Transcript_102011:110-1606(+)